MSHNTQLISPAADMAETYASYIRELEERNEPRAPWVLDLVADDFDELIDRLLAFPNGVEVKPGFVNHSTFWLIDENRTLLGVSNLRHQLTPRLEKDGGHIGYGVRPSVRGQGHATRLPSLTLLEAKKIGINRALLTCDKQNIASSAVILKNGGSLDAECDDENGITKQRYWIEIR